jgi:predicted ribonuclease YlaK
MQLILQRVGEDCVCVIEGDDKAQVDLNVYEGNNNGLAKAAQTFRGEYYYGEVRLQNCYRSKIAAQAEKMRI